MCYNRNTRGGSQHNTFTATGAFDNLATNTVGQANLLAADYGLGHLVYTGLDSVCRHLSDPGAVAFIQNAVDWAAESSAATVALPASLPLLFAGLAGIGFASRRWKKANA